MRQPIWLLPFHLLFAALGVWRITSGGGVGVAVGLIMLALAGLGIASLVAGRLGGDARQRRLVDRARRQHRGDLAHAHRTADDKDLEEVDAAWLDATAAALAVAGFRPVGDVVDETLEERGRFVLLRCLVDDAHAAATLLHLPGPLGGRGVRVVAVESILRCGGDVLVVAADDAGGVDVAPDPPGLRRRRLPAGTPPAEVAAAHAALLADASADGLTPAKVKTLDDVLALQRQLHALHG